MLKKVLAVGVVGGAAFVGLKWYAASGLDELAVSELLFKSNCLYMGTGLCR